MTKRATFSLPCNGQLQLSMEEQRTAKLPNTFLFTPTEKKKKPVFKYYFKFIELLQT